MEWEGISVLPPPTRKAIMEPRVLLAITTPENRTRHHRAYRAYVGKNRVTWITMDGVRHYVLLRHGFSYKITNL